MGDHQHRAVGWGPERVLSLEGNGLSAFWDEQRRTGQVIFVTKEQAMGTSSRLRTPYRGDGTLRVEGYGNFGDSTGWRFYQNFETHNSFLVCLISVRRAVIPTPLRIRNDMVVHAIV